MSSKNHGSGKTNHYSQPKNSGAPKKEKKPSERPDRIPEDPKPQLMPYTTENGVYVSVEKQKKMKLAGKIIGIITGIFAIVFFCSSLDYMLKAFDSQMNVPVTYYIGNMILIPLSMICVAAYYAVNSKKSGALLMIPTVILAVLSALNIVFAITNHDPAWNVMESILVTVSFIVLALYASGLKPMQRKMWAMLPALVLFIAGLTEVFGEIAVVQAEYQSLSELGAEGLGTESAYVWKNIKEYSIIILDSLKYDAFFMMVFYQIFALPKEGEKELF